MCIMEEHVTEVLCSSDSAIQPWAVVNALPRKSFQVFWWVFLLSGRGQLPSSSSLGIGGNFQLGMQDDAHEFLCYALRAMQTACLSGSSQ